MAGRGNGRGGRHLLRAHAALVLLVGVTSACSGAPQPTPEPRPTRDASLEREVGIYTAAIHEVLDVPGLEIEGTVWLVELTDPNGPVAGKPGPKLADDVVEGLVDELSEVTLRPVASFRDAFEGGHPKDEGVVVNRVADPRQERSGRGER